MSGYADYSIATSDSILITDVPIIKATSENFALYGNIVSDFDTEKVIITPWPTLGKRKLMPDTGISGVIEDKFIFWNSEKYTHAQNIALGCEAYTTSIIKEDKLLIREANYHPDGGQVFFSDKKEPFYLLLALPTDYIKPSDFVAFYFDGVKHKGCQINPNIWHQPPYPISNHIVTFRNKQAAIHACVGYDSIIEDNTWLAITPTRE